MSKTISSIVAAALLIGTAGTSALAASSTVSGGTIHFIGSVADAACSVSPDSEHGLVLLDQVTLDSLGTTKGTASGQAKPFYITLEDCDVTTIKNAAVTFNGQSSADQAGALANNAGSGAATGVALQIYGPDGKPLNLGTASTTQTLSSGTNKIPMSVDYISTSDAPTSGAVESVATFEITYS
ncbi:fimbrial protein [Atlantibacter sp.]|uniref:fimbrial protein n=1 Tax=Atlantibacter sp. TaxID=1903473 RepID=UPI0028A0FC80|nr:fimbrial protein [Atlantibacter sp.]